LFVSHNLSTIARLCDRTILFDNGEIIKDGNTEAVLSHYLKSGLGISPQYTWTDEDAPGNEIVRLKSIRVISEQGIVIDTLDIRNSVRIEMDYIVLKQGNILTPTYQFYNEHGICLFTTLDNVQKWKNKIRNTGEYKSVVEVPGNFLAEGTILVGAGISTINPEKIHFFEKDAVCFNVIDPMEGDSARTDYIGNLNGVVRPIFKWQTEYRN